MPCIPIYVHSYTLYLASHVCCSKKYETFNKIIKLLCDRILFSIVIDNKTRPMHAFPSKC